MCQQVLYIFCTYKVKYIIIQVHYLFSGCDVAINVALQIETRRSGGLDNTFLVVTIW